MTAKKPVRTDAEVKKVCEQRIRGLKQYGPTTGTIPCKGKQYTTTELVDIYQSCIDKRTALVDVRQQEKTAEADRKAADSARAMVDKSVVNWAVETFGPESVQATAIGYVAPEPKQPSAATKAKAVEQAQETKKARGIMGKKQRAKIKAPPDPAPTPGANPKPPANGGNGGNGTGNGSGKQ